MTNKSVRIALSVALAAGLLTTLFASMPFGATTSMTALARPADAHKVEKFRVTNTLAEAQWDIEDEEEEMFTRAAIYLVDSASKGGYGYPESSLSVFIVQYRLVEECEDEDEEECDYDYEPVTYFGGYTGLDKSDFKISSNLRSAVVKNVQVTGYDYLTGDEKTITVDATWTGQGNTFKNKHSFTESNEYYRLTFKASGTGRDAQATAQITGDINLTLNADGYQDALLFKAKEGSMYRILNNDP